MVEPPVICATNGDWRMVKDVDFWDRIFCWLPGIDTCSFKRNALQLCRVRKQGCHKMTFHNLSYLKSIKFPYILITTLRFLTIRVTPYVWPGAKLCLGMSSCACDVDNPKLAKLTACKFRGTKSYKSAKNKYLEAEASPAHLQMLKMSIEIKAGLEKSLDKRRTTLAL